MLSVFVLCCSSVALQAQHQAKGFFDQQANAQGNVQIMLTNYGIIGSNIAQSRGGTFWKRGTDNQYIYAGGAWLGTLKRANTGTILNKMVLLTYSPNSGVSWMSPTVSQPVATYNDSIRSARSYFSTDFNSQGTPNAFNDIYGYQNWPIWKKANGNYFGEYINDTTLRNSISGTPAFVSSEDVICNFNDSDLNRYDGGADVRSQLGYPLGVNINQRVYSFGSGALSDVIIIRYEVTHTGADTLFDCWFAPALDPDIGPQAHAQAIAENDNLRYYTEEPSLNLVVAWTSADLFEMGKGFGYMGCSFLQTPATDPNHYIMSSSTPLDELGLKTHRNWTVENNPLTDNEYYDFIAAGIIEGQTAANDKRILMATGPFNLRPNETAVVSYAIMFANTSGGEATGETADMADLVQLCKYTKQQYNGFRTTDVDEDTPKQTLSVYPNPVSELSTIEYTVDAPAMVSVELFDAMSRRVAILVNESLAPGRYHTTFNTANLPAGVYYYRVEKGDVIEIKKIVVVR